MKKVYQGATERYQFILWVCGIIFLAWSALQIFLLFWYNLPFPQGFTDSLISGFIFSISCFIVANALHFYQPGKERYSYILVWVLSLAGLATYFSKLLINWLLANDAYLNRSEERRVGKECSDQWWWDNYTEKVVWSIW